MHQVTCRSATGGLVIDRTERILLNLMRADQALTSVQLAEAIGVSSRTIKTAMAQVAAALQAHGARLESKRNCGYRIVIEREDEYKELVEQIELQAMHINMANYDHAARVLHIERRLVSSPEGVLVDQICDELALSRSAVQRSLKEAVQFCKGFHLDVLSSRGHGMRVVGEEHMVRLALMELFEIHFDTFMPDVSIAEYARWIACEDQERRDIRHEFLRVLRESAISLRDGVTQRVAIYLIIMRNRRQAGLQVLLPKTWVSEIRECACYDVAVDILSALSARFPGFGVSNDEAAFFAILLLRYLDVDLNRDARSISPYLYPLAHRAANDVLAGLEWELGGGMREITGIQAFMEQCLLPFVAAQRYGLDGAELYEYDAEQSIARDPVCVFLADIMGRLVERALGCRISRSDIRFFAAAMMWMLDGAAFPTRPLRLLVTNTMGTAFARRQLEQLQTYFPQLIGESEALELYEIRGMDPRRYDAVVSDVVTGYRYDAPRGWYRIHLDSSSLAAIHDEMLVDAYCYEQFTWRPQQISVVHDMCFDNAEQLVQALTLRYATDARPALERVSALKRQLFILEPPGEHRRGFLFDEVDCAEDEGVDWYEFQRAISWGNRRVDTVLYMRVHLAGGLMRMKALSRMCLFVERLPAGWSGTPEEIAAKLRELLRDSFKFAQV